MKPPLKTLLTALANGAEAAEARLDRATARELRKRKERVHGRGSKLRKRGGKCDRSTPRVVARFTPLCSALEGAE